MPLENESEETVSIKDARDALERWRTNFWEHQEPPISHLYKYMMEPLDEATSDEEFNWRVTQMTEFLIDLKLLRGFGVK